MHSEQSVVSRDPHQLRNRISYTGQDHDECGGGVLVGEKTRAIGICTVKQLVGPCISTSTAPLHTTLYTLSFPLYTHSLHTTQEELMGELDKDASVIVFTVHLYKAREARSYVPKFTQLGIIKNR